MKSDGRRSESMEIVIVPNQLRDLIQAKLDEQIVLHPAAEADREELYSQLLGFFNEYGYVPDFELSKRPA